MLGVDDGDELGERLVEALRSGDDRALRAHLLSASGLPGPRLNLRLVGEFAAAVGALIQRPGAPVARLEALLDGWAGLGTREAPVVQPEVILPCAAVAAYGEAARVRPEWWADEMAKLRRAAGDPRWRVREVAAGALRRVLDVDWDRTAAALAGWAADDNPLVVRAAVTAVAEPALLGDPSRWDRGMEIQRLAVGRLATTSSQSRREDSVRALRKALGFTISVVTAVSGDFTLLEELATSSDADLRWIAKQNIEKARLRRWPERVAALRERLLA